MLDVPCLLCVEMLSSRVDGSGQGIASLYLSNSCSQAHSAVSWRPITVAEENEGNYVTLDLVLQ